MKRRRLKRYANQRITVSGKFIRYGQDYNGGRTALLRHIVNAANGRFICDHIWLCCGRHRVFPSDCLKGDLIQFRATVRKFPRGFYLVAPVNIRVIQPIQMQ